jgi:hypothetical protein
LWKFIFRDVLWEYSKICSMTPVVRNGWWRGSGEQDLRELEEGDLDCLGLLLVQRRRFVKLLAAVKNVPTSHALLSALEDAPMRCILQHC